MTGGDTLKQSAEALILAGRWAAERVEKFRARWPARQDALVGEATRRWPAARAWMIARVKTAAPRFALASVGMIICAIGYALIAPGDEPSLAPSIDSADLRESTAAIGEWLPIPKPIALYSLESPELPAGARSYEARRHSIGGGREDILSFNDFDEDKLYLSLRLYRPGQEPQRISSLFVDMARQAAQDGLAIERMSTASDMATKFGAAESADALISAGADRRACIVFRFSVADGAAAASGVACGTEARPIDRAQLICLIDRTALLASNDEQIRLAFARADLNRPAACANGRYAGAARRATWLDPAGQAPALKGPLATKR